MATLSRRTALALTGAGLAAALSTTAATSSELDRLFEVHRRALQRFEAALDAENEFDQHDAERRELFVPLAIGHTVSLHASRYLRETVNGFRTFIGAQYRDAFKAASVMERLSPDLGKQATERLRKAQAHDLRTMRRVIREEQQRREAIGYAACIREWYAACDAEKDALESVLAYRCTTFEQLSVKVAYDKKALDGCHWETWQTDAFIGSMLLDRRV